MGSEDEVRLAVPARPEFLGLVRVTAAGLASRLGFTFDQVEDLRLAIDEISFGMTGSKGPGRDPRSAFPAQLRRPGGKGRGALFLAWAGSAFRIIRSYPQCFGGRAFNERWCRWPALCFG